MYNIMVSANGRLEMHDLFIVNLSREPVQATIRIDHSRKIGHLLENVHQHAYLPSLWRWLQLWWQYRHLRKAGQRTDYFISMKTGIAGLETEELQHG